MNTKRYTHTLQYFCHTLTPNPNTSTEILIPPNTTIYSFPSSTLAALYGLIVALVLTTKT